MKKLVIVLTIVTIIVTGICAAYTAYKTNNERYMKRIKSTSEIDRFINFATEVADNIYVDFAHWFRNDSNDEELFEVWNLKNNSRYFLSMDKINQFIIGR